MAARPAEEVVDDREHQLRVEHDQRRPAERVDLHHIEARGHVQRVHVFAELLDVHRMHCDFRRAAQQVVQADTEESGEAFVDHLERGHAPAHDTHCVDQVVRLGLALCDPVFRGDGPGVDAVDQGVDLGLVEYLVVAHPFTATA